MQTTTCILLEGTPSADSWYSPSTHTQRKASKGKDCTTLTVWSRDLGQVPYVGPPPSPRLKASSC